MQTAQVAVWLAVVSALAVGCAAAAQKTLVVVDTLQTRTTHSAFFGLLEAQGHVLTFSRPMDEGVQLRKYGEFQFDNLVLFAPNAEDLTGVNGAEGVSAFLNAGHSVIVAAHQNASELIREIAKDVGIIFDDPETAVVDHFLFDASDASGLHTRVALPPSSLLASPVLLPHPPAAPVLFAGIGHAADHSRLVARVLTGAATTYSAVPSQRVAVAPQSAGAETLLVSALQMRNNARMLVAGSLDLFSNQFFALSVHAAGATFAKSGNEAFCAQLAQWTLGGHGRLRASALSHHLAAAGAASANGYRIKDDIAVSVVVEQFDAAAQQWVPFAAPDVQLEVVMIDPYIRTALRPDSKGVFSAKLTLPDVYGVFKFVVNYHRLGYGNLEIAEQVSVRPFKHDEFERFLPVAYPYYASAFSMMAGFFVFGLVFLYAS